MSCRRSGGREGRAWDEGSHNPTDQADEDIGGATEE